MARVEIPNTIMKGPGTLVAVYGAAVQVNVRSGGPATVYVAETGTATRQNPLTSDAVGRIEGWVEEGSYDLVVSKGPPQSITEYTERFEAISAAEGGFGARLDSVESNSAAAGVLARKPQSGHATLGTQFQFVSEADGNDTADGRAWGSAKRSIEAAVAATPQGGVIFVAPGSYSPTGTVALNGHRIIGFGFAQSGLASAAVVVRHTFDGDLFSHVAGSKGGGLSNMLLNQEQKAVGNYTGAAIKATSTATDIAGYHVYSELIITGAGGWERDVWLDGSAHASGVRSVFFRDCLFFGCYTVGETVVLNKPIHVFFTACDVVQAPAAVQQGVKITGAASEDVQWTGKVLGDWSTEAAGGGCWFFGRITGTITCQAGSANNKFHGAFSGGTYTNLGGSGNYRSDATPAVRVRKTVAQTLVSATLTAITFDAEDFDTEAIHDNATNNTRLTVRTAGKYQIYGTLCFAANTAGSRAIVFRKNGATYLGGHSGAPNPTGGSRTDVSASCTADLAAGDFVECMGEQISSVGLAVDVADSSIGIPTHFGMERIG